MKKFLLMAVATLMSSAAMAQLQAGKYFVKNNESGQFLANGANWGTRSVLFGRGIEYDVTVSGGKYTLKSGIKNTSNALRPSDGFNDQSGAWEIIPTEGGYYMYNGSQYFCNAANGIPTFKATPDASCVWSFVTADERKALLADASKTAPVDATVFIEAADFHNGDVRNNTAWNIDGSGGEGGSTSVLLNSHNAERWNKGQFEISQTLTGLPNGLYTVSCQGFTRKSGASTASADSYENGEVLQAYLFAGSMQEPLKSVFEGATTNDGYAEVTSTAGNKYYIPNGQNTAAKKFNQDAYWVTLENVVVTDGKLKIGVKSNGGIEWVVFDSFRLTYYGVDLSILEASLNTAIANANALLSSPMNKDVKAALTLALSTYGSTTPTTEEGLNAAIGALNAANTDAEASANIYVQIAAIDINSLTDTGKAASAIATKYNAGEYTTLAEAEADFRLAVLAQTEDGADFTGAIINPNFDGNINGWIDGFNGAANNHGYQGASYSNGSVSISQFMECWRPQPNTLGNAKLSQIVKGLPAGNYTLSADLISVQQSGSIAKADQKGVFVFATCAAGTFRSADCSTGNGAPEHYEFTFNTTAGDCELGLMTENTNCNWVAFDNCRLVRNGASTVNVYQEALKEGVAEAAAPATYDDVEADAAVKAAYTAAYNAATTTSTTDGLTDDEYHQAGNTLAEAKAALDASVAGYAASKTLRDAITAGTNSAKYPDTIEGWSTVGFTNGNFHTNDWSLEGNGDGTLMYAAGSPDGELSFAENWYSKGNNLVDGAIKYTTMCGLTPGKYAVSLLVRLYNEDGDHVEGVDFEGIDLASNLTNVTYNALTGVYGVVTAVKEVGTDGKLDFQFNIHSAQANWLAYKGLTIKYLGAEETDATATLKVTAAAKYGTYFAPYTTAIPTGVKAFTTSAIEGKSHLTLVEVTGAIPANTPVLLEAADATEDVVAPNAGVSYRTIAKDVKGLLVGVYEATPAIEGTYVLQNQAAGVGFYKVETAGVTTIPANRAYLTVPDSNVKAFILGDEETAIQAIEALTAGKAQIYDLNGRQLSRLQKGINIVNGKKIMVK